jgi:hypothetical protein
LPKNLLAALVEYVAPAILHASEQCPHCLKPLNAIPELRDFSLGKLMPAFRWRRPGWKPEKELAYLLQGESRFAGALHYGETKKRALSNHSCDLCAFEAV